MGFKTAFILIDGAKGADVSELADVLKLREHKHTLTRLADIELFPEEGKTKIAKWRDLFIVLSWDVVEDMLYQTDSDNTKALVSQYHGSNIMLGYLHSGNNSFGYELYSNAVKLRTRLGDHDDPEAVSFGDVLSEELTVQANADDDDTPDVLGENMVFELTKRFFNGYSMYDLDSLVVDELHIYTPVVKSTEEVTPKKPKKEISNFVFGAIVVGLFVVIRLCYWLFFEMGS